MINIIENNLIHRIGHKNDMNLYFHIEITILLNQWKYILYKNISIGALDMIVNPL